MICFQVEPRKASTDNKLKLLNSKIEKLIMDEMRRHIEMKNMAGPRLRRHLIMRQPAKILTPTMAMLINKNPNLGIQGHKLVRLIQLYLEING